jgi:hypothetical protein
MIGIHARNIFLIMLSGLISLGISFARDLDALGLGALYYLYMPVLICLGTIFIYLIGVTSTKEKLKLLLIGCTTINIIAGLVLRFTTF